MFKISRWTKEADGAFTARMPGEITVSVVPCERVYRNFRSSPRRGTSWRVMIDLQESSSVRRRYGPDTYNVTYSNAREAMAAAPEVYRASVLAESLEPCTR